MAVVIGATNRKSSGEYVFASYTFVAHVTVVCGKSLCQQLEAPIPVSEIFGINRRSNNKNLQTDDWRSSRERFRIDCHIRFLRRIRWENFSFFLSGLVYWRGLEVSRVTAPSI
jgi:hypothetical protein